MKRLQIITTTTIITLLLISAFVVYNKHTDTFNFSPESSFDTAPDTKKSNDDLKYDSVIMGVMGNKTEKEELGRATWKFLHTMMARYPEAPTESERKSLHDFMMLFSTLYPCGECAKHFNKLITTYPPQTSSRFAASQWLCAMHNNVNERLGKPEFECNNIDSRYPCGCAAEEPAE